MTLCAVFSLWVTYIQSLPSGEKGIIVTIFQMRTLRIRKFCALLKVAGLIHGDGRI